MSFGGTTDGSYVDPYATVQAELAALQEQQKAAELAVAKEKVGLGPAVDYVTGPIRGVGALLGSPFRDISAKFSLDEPYYNETGEVRSVSERPDFKAFNAPKTSLQQKKEEVGTIGKQIKQAESKLAGIEMSQMPPKPKTDSKFDVTQTLPSDYDQIGINSDAAIKAMQGAAGGQGAGIAALGRGLGGKSAVDMLKESGALQEVPGEKTVSDFMKEKQKAREDAGIKDVYAAQRTKYQDREAELTGDKSKSVGKALMSAGVALMGGKNWAEGLAKAGEAGLQTYSADMDKIEARHDKLQEANDLLDRAEYAEKLGDVDKAVELRRENEKIIREVKQSNAQSLLNATLVDKKELGDNYRTMVQAQLAAGNTDKQIVAGLYETKLKLQASFKEAQIGYDKAMDVATAQARLEFAKDKRKSFETLVTAAMKNDALMQEAQEIVLKKYPNEPGRIGEVLQGLARGSAIQTMNYISSMDEIDSTMASLSPRSGGIASIEKVK